MACPVCGSRCFVHDVMDFNISYKESAGKFPPLCGRPVYYSTCEKCAFTFSPDMYTWSTKDLSEHVYNDDYVLIDPEYVEQRPRSNAALIQSLFGASKNILRHVDYGGGNGKLSAILRDAGWRSISYDPFDSSFDIGSMRQTFDLVTAFEVFEHAQDVNKLMADLRTLSNAQTLVLFSTLVSDGRIDPHGRLNWWYISPRAGHISLFSRKSLDMLATKHKLKLASFNAGLHVLFDTIPAWAAHLVGR